MTSHRNFDVAVVGAGLAGLALAAELVERGAHVTLVDPEPRAPWRRTWCAFEDELPAWVPRKQTWSDARVELPRRTLLLGRRYAQVDSKALQRALWARAMGVEVVRARALGRCDGGLATSAGLVEAGTVIDCSGASGALGGGSATAYQTAFGLELEVDTHPWDPGQAVWMELTALATEPSFLYVLPRDAHRVFVEETALAARPALPLEVLDVQLPAQVLAVQGDGLPRTVLSGVCSIVVDPRPSVQQGYVRGAAARMWPGPDGWTVEVPGSPPRPLEAGQAIEAEGLRARAVAVALSEAEVGATRRSGGLQSPLRLVARYDSVHLHRDGRPPVVLSGLAARLVSELVAMDGPVPWDVLACQLWPRVDDKHVRRRRLDLTLSRLRRRLADAGVRRDLLRSDGAGHVELVLDADDTVEDAS